MLTCGDTRQIRLQCLDRADHIRYHIRTAILGRQFRDSGLDCERGSDSDSDAGYGATASGRKQDQADSFSELGT